jgi:hypothetical protein
VRKLGARDPVAFRAMTDILGRCLTWLVVNPAVGRGDAATEGSGRLPPAAAHDTAKGRVRRHYAD